MIYVSKRRLGNAPETGKPFVMRWGDKHFYDIDVCADCCKSREEKLTISLTQERKVRRLRKER